MVGTARRRAGKGARGIAGRESGSGHVERPLGWNRKKKKRVKTSDGCLWGCLPGSNAGDDARFRPLSPSRPGTLPWLAAGVRKEKNLGFPVVGQINDSSLRGEVEHKKHNRGSLQARIHVPDERVGYLSPSILIGHHPAILSPG